MKHNVILSAAAMLLTATVASAQTVDFDRGGFDLGASLKEVKVSAPAVSEAVAVNGEAETRAKSGKAEWTIMVFANGKNNLEPFALRDVNEMELVGSTDKVNIVVQLGRIAGFDNSDGDWKGVRRYLVQKDDNPNKITSPVVQDLGMVDMGDYRNMIDFGKWAKKNYPAKKYMLIFWNHGAGWIKSIGGHQPITRGISYDEQSGNHINTPQMAQVLKEIGGVNVVGSDACLMQMVEVDYEIKDHATYIVGSEETEPGDGYTYNDFLNPVIKKPTMQGAELAKIAVDAYSNHYQKQNGGYTQSYVKSSAMPQLLKSLNEFAYAVTQANDIAAAKYARDNAIKFAYAENKDLYDFVSLLVSRSSNSDVKAKGQALMSQINKTVGHNRTKDEPGSYWSAANKLTRAKGIAIYIPSKPVNSDYQELQFAKYSNWDEFVGWLASK